jgi:hypothetical protein
MDDWVYEFSKANTNPVVQWHEKPDNYKMPPEAKASLGNTQIVEGFAQQPDKIPQARTTFYNAGNGIWRALAQEEPKAAAAEDAPPAEDGKAPADTADKEPPKPKTVAELHPEWANSQQQIGWTQQRAANSENFADQASLYKSW